MKTLLHITLEDDGQIGCEGHFGFENLPRIAMVLHKTAMENPLFEAVLCTAFEILCHDRPQTLEHLQESLKKGKPAPTPAIEVKPNPTKS